MKQSSAIYRRNRTKVMDKSLINFETVWQDRDFDGWLTYATYSSRGRMPGKCYWDQMSWPATTSVAVVAIATRPTSLRSAWPSEFALPSFYGTSAGCSMQKSRVSQKSWSKKGGRDNNTLTLTWAILCQLSASLRQSSTVQLVEQQLWVRFF